MCFTCNKAFETDDMLMMHKSSEHVDPRFCKYKCSIEDCKKAFVLEKHLTVHLKTEHAAVKKSAVVQMACSICTRKYNNVKDLKRHTSMKHLNRNPSTNRLEFFCFICQVFYEKQELVNHFPTHMTKPLAIKSNSGYFINS